MLADFYSDVLPSAGRYVLFLGTSKKHVWCDTLDDLTRETEKRAATPDVYFAVSSFSETTGRTAENALLSRAFYFDIDAGPEKHAKHGDKVYPTQAEAKRAVGKWCADAGIAPSYVISSGAGLHVYFILDKDTPIADWKPVADGLKARALADGLRIDPAVTGDAARVLRPVGSLHHSGETVSVVLRTGKTYPLEQIRALAGTYVPTPKKRVSRLNDEILSAPIGPPKSLERIQKHCPAMAHAMSLRGDVAEPYWRAMIGVIKHTVEGADAAHTYSRGHPEYSYDATQDKYDRWHAGPTTCAVFEAENPSACATCAYKDKVKSPALLGSMPAEEVAKLPPPPPKPEPTAEPLPFSDDDGEAPPKRMPWDGHMPEGFRVERTTNGYAMVGKVQVPAISPTGERIFNTVETKFCSVPFWFESWAAGSNDMDQALAIYCVYDAATDHVTRFTFPTRLAAKNDTLFGALAAQNVQVFPNTANAKTAMVDNVKAQIERIRQLGLRQKILERFGTMHDRAGNIIIAQGSHLIDHQGNVSEGVVHEKLRQRGMAYRVPVPHRMNGNWGPDIWDADIKPRAVRHIEYLREFYDEPNFSQYQLAIMLAWASPMLAFTQGSYRPGNELPGAGLTVSLYSPASGIGKTACMHAAALAFGSPTDLCLQLDRGGSTSNARQMIIVQSGTMPVFIDEMEDVPAADLASLVQAVGNGAPKQRLDKTLSLQGTTKFSVINVMSTNKSHREIVSAARDESAATQLRMLEIDCSSVAPVPPSRARQETDARSMLYDCAGAVGAIIHRRMAAMGSDALNTLGVECADKAREMLSGRQDGRFLWRAFGAMLAVRRILKLEGLQVFSLDTLRNEFQKWHDAGYEFAEDHILPVDGGPLIARFLSDISGNTLVTLTESQRHGGDESKADIPLNDRIPSDVKARAVLKGRYVYVKTSALRDWCTEKKLGFQATVNKARGADLIELPDPKSVRQFAQRVDLFKGTKLAQGVRDSVVKFWLDKLPGEVMPVPANAENVIEMKRRAAAEAPAATEQSA